MTAGIILTEISDHLPCFASFNLNNTFSNLDHKFHPIECVQRKWTSELAQQLYIQVLSKDIYSQLDHNPNADPNINYNINLNIVFPRLSILLCLTNTLNIINTGTKNRSG